MKKVIIRGKKSNTLSEVKPIENTSNNLQSFLEIRYVQKEVLLSHNSCRDALPCSNIALKLPWYFYLLMEKPLGRCFEVQSPYYKAAQCNQKTPIPVSSR